MKYNKCPKCNSKFNEKNYDIILGAKLVYCTNCDFEEQITITEKYTKIVNIVKYRYNNICPKCKQPLCNKFGLYFFDEVNNTVDVYCENKGCDWTNQLI